MPEPRKKLPKRAAIYHRVSTKEQNATNASRVLRSAARQRRAHVVAEIQEHARGTGRRPGLERLLQLCRGAEVDIVLVWKIDRLGRSMLDVLSTIEAIDRTGTEFVAVDQGIHIKQHDAIGRMQLAVMAACAEIERGLIGDRTRLGLERARREGRTLGRPRLARPSGALVQRMKARGDSWATIAAELGTTVWRVRQAHEAAKTPAKKGGIARASKKPKKAARHR